MSRKTYRFRIIIPNGPATEDSCEALSAGIALSLMEARYPECQVYYLGEA